MPNNVNKGAFVADVPIDGNNPMMDWTEKPGRGKSKKNKAGDDLEFTQLGPKEETKRRARASIFIPKKADIKKMKQIEFNDGTEF